MPSGEKKYYKAIYFDLKIKALEKHFSAKNSQKAYRKIRKFFLRQKFTHAQQSGYHSTFKTTDLYIFDLIYTMKGEFPWLCFCAGRFEVTNVGEHYNLMEVFAEEAMELKVTQ